MEEGEAAASIIAGPWREAALFCSSAIRGGLTNFYLSIFERKDDLFQSVCRVGLMLNVVCRNFGFLPFFLWRNDQKTGDWELCTAVWVH